MSGGDGDAGSAGDRRLRIDRLTAWADALGCDVTLTVRPAPPTRTRFDSIEELRQDMRETAWARRVAAPGKPDDIEELKRRLAEYKAEKEGDGND